MLDTRTNEWLARLQSNGPYAVSIALAVLIAVEFARMAVALVGGHVKTPEPVIAATPAGHQRPAANVQTVISAHLFGVAVADPTTQDPDKAPLSSANLVLAGTIATQDPKRGIAIISDGGPSKVYSIGDNVNGASLYSVYLDHVILDRAGTLETLLLPRLIAGSRAAPRMSRRIGGDARTVAAVDSVRRMVQQDPASWTRSCARCRRTTTPRGSCAAFALTRAGIAPFLINWGCSLETWSRQSTGRRWMIRNTAKRYSIRSNRPTPLPSRSSVAARNRRSP